MSERAELTLVTVVTMAVELKNGRVTRLVDVVDESRSLEGISTPIRIGGLTVAPGRLSDGEYRGLVDALVTLKARSTTCA